jgi:hypothetical protein
VFYTRSCESEPIWIRRWSPSWVSSSKSDRLEARSQIGFANSHGRIIDAGFPVGSAPTLGSLQTNLAAS